MDKTARRNPKFSALAKIVDHSRPKPMVSNRMGRNQFDWGDLSQINAVVKPHLRLSLVGEEES